MKISLFVVSILAISLFFSSLASATYITGNIYLNEDGNARFEIETDLETNISGLTFQDKELTGTTNQLLTLRGGVWTLELLFGEYDDIFVNIHLPSNLVSIRSVSGSDNIIDIEKKTVTIADSGKLEFTMSYELKEKRSYAWLYWVVLIIILTGGFFTYKKITKKKERFENIMPMINEKEQQIIDILMKKPVRQKELRNTLSLPKASFSRYMVNLEKKKLIIRDGEGKNKVVRLK